MIERMKTDYKQWGEDFEKSLRITKTSLRQFSRDTGISASTLSRFVRGLIVPNPDVLFTTLEFMQQDVGNYRYRA